MTDVATQDATQETEAADDAATDAKPRVATVYVKQLVAAYEIASRDGARPGLCQVAIWPDPAARGGRPPIVGATDSYALIAISGPDVTPAEIAERLKSPRDR